MKRYHILIIYLSSTYSLLWRWKSTLYNSNAFWRKLLLEAVGKSLFLKVLFLNFLQDSQKKYFCWSLFVIKLQRMQSFKLIKTKLRCRCFPFNFLKQLFIEHLRVTAFVLCEILTNYLSEFYTEGFSR